MDYGINARYLPITIGITGHINIDSESLGRSEKYLSDVFDEIALRYPHTPIRLLASLAEGSDRCAVRAFLQFRAKFQNFGMKQHEFIAVLPLPKELFILDFPSSADEFEELLVSANAHFCVPVEGDLQVEDVERRGAARDQQYRAASRYVAAHCDILIALWDGYDCELTGGTSETIRMRLQGMDLLTQLSSSPLAGIGIRPVLHVGVRRVANVTVARAEDILTHENFHRELKALLHSLPDLSEIEGFNSSAHRLVPRAAIEKSAAYMFDDISLASRIFQTMSFAQRSCLELFATCDALAVQCEKRWRRTARAIYGFGILSACIIPMAIESIFLPWMLVGYFSVLGLSALFHVYLRATRIENLHLESRALAELLRVQFSLLCSDSEGPKNHEQRGSINAAVFSVPITRLLLAQQQRDLGWIYWVFNSLPLFRSPTDLQASELDRRASVVGWISEQSRYFHISSLKSERRAGKYFALSVSMVVLGLASAAIAIMLSIIQHPSGVRELPLHLFREILVVLAAALPICAVVVEKASDHFGVEVQAKVRHRMHEVFTTSRNRLSADTVSEELRHRIIVETGREAVTEAVVWLFYRRIRPAKFFF